MTAISPKVSVLCLAYNQKKFIRQCLDGILMQKTNFEFEVLINDDASTDGTKEIIQEYQKSHPNIVKPVFHRENQYSQNKRNMIIRYLLPKISGEYLALCEGDDFWTDENKLQKQVDFLEKNPDNALCFHPVKVVFENSEEKDSVYPNIEKGTAFTTAGLLKENFIQTNSVMYRRQKYKDMPTDVMPGDWYLHLYHAQFGKIGFINEVMAVYRRHSGGIWWTSHQNKDKFWEKYGLFHLKMYFELIKLYGDKKSYKIIVYESISKTLDSLIDIDEKKDKKLLATVLTQLPNGGELIKAQRGSIKEREQILVAKEQQISDLYHAVKLKDDHIDNLEEALRSIKNSRSWRIAEKITSVSSRVKGRR